MTKRIEFFVNIDDDKLFDESIKAAMDGYAKTVARQAVEEKITMEVNRVVGNYHKSITGDHGWISDSNIVKQIVIQKVAVDLRAFYETDEFKAMLTDSISKLFEETKFKKLVGDAAKLYLSRMVDIAL